MNTPNFTFSEQNNTLGVSAIAKGISGYIGRFKRGPINQPDVVIYGWEQFEKLFGGFVQDTTDPLLVYRALDAGANLRISRVAHYTDLTDADTLTADKAALGTCILMMIDRDTASGSVFSATLTGNPVSAMYVDSHLNYMTAIANAFTLPGLTEGKLFYVGSDLRGIAICQINSNFQLNLVAPIFAGTVDGPNVGASASIEVVAPLLVGSSYEVKNATAGLPLIGQYTSLLGDDVDDVIAGLIASDSSGNYALSAGVSPNLIITGLASLGATINNNWGSIYRWAPEVYEVLPQVLYTIGVGGLFGENVSMVVDGLQIGQFTISSTPIQTSILLGLNAGNEGFFSQYAGQGIIKIIAPEGSGTQYNNLIVEFVTTGVFAMANPLEEFTGGVDFQMGNSNTASGPFLGGVNGGVGNPVVTQSTSIGIADALGRTLFNLVPKYAGADYNNLKIRITDANNNNPNFFNLFIDHITDPSLSEQYLNLTISGFPNISDSNFLSGIVNYSQIVDVEYLDLSVLIDQITYPILRPLRITAFMMGGDDGDALTVNDYIGNTNSQSGFHTFNAYSDMMQFCAGEQQSIELHEAGAEYAQQMKSIVYLGHIDSGLTFIQMIALMEASSIDTSYAAFYTGSLKVKHPSTGATLVISEIGDILGAFARSDAEFGEWAAVYNETRGLISKTIGVFQNFGGPGNYEKLNALANNRINAVITENGKTMIWGNATAERTTSVTNFLNIRRLGLLIKKELSPVMKSYLSEPNDVPTWMAIYVRVKPYLDGLVQKRALYEYNWQGDQFAASLNNLTVNDPIQVQLGKYKAKLSCSPIPGMNDFSLILSYDFVEGTFDVETS